MMRIFEQRLSEVDKLPERAGEAMLRFSEHTQTPAREGEIITIPHRPGVEFFPLKDGTQFLLGITDAESRGSYWTGTDNFLLYFGGTDERPFLVQLDPEAFCYFDEGGEEAFFEALKPEIIRSYEAQWGRERTKRQGDIFAYELPWASWQELVDSQWRRGTEIVLRDVEERLFGTRHVLMGSKALISRGSNPELAPAFVATGTIVTPDHSPLFLQIPHQVIQADLLLRPSEAE